MKNLTILLAAILISTSSYGKGKKFTYSDTTFNYIEFTEITFSLDKKTKDTLQIEGVLKQQTIIDGIPCYGNISFHPDWGLRTFTLAGEFTFGEHLFPKDTYVGISIDWLSLDAGYFKTIGGDTVNTCKFPSTQLISGLSCDGKEVTFTTEWNLRACILGDDDTIAGHVLKKGTLVRFSENGGFSVFCLYDPIIQGYHSSGTNYKFWMGGGGIHFYPNGNIRLFTPVEDIEVQGVYCRSSCIWFYESGNIKRCTSAKEQMINGKLYDKKLTLKFDEEGNITESYKAKFF